MLGRTRDQMRPARSACSPSLVWKSEWATAMSRSAFCRIVASRNQSVSRTRSPLPDQREPFPRTHPIPLSRDPPHPRSSRRDPWPQWIRCSSIA